VYKKHCTLYVVWLDNIELKIYLFVNEIRNGTLPLHLLDYSIHSMSIHSMSTFLSTIFNATFIHPSCLLPIHSTSNPLLRKLNGLFELINN